MSMKTEDYEEFQRQLALQNTKETSTVKTKKDEDGTEYEWDEEKKAWFPRLTTDLMIRYQSGYSDGNEQSSHSTYLDPQTKIKYVWDSVGHSWKPETSQSSYPDNYSYTDPSTGSKYKWDTSKQSWFLCDPKPMADNDKNDEKSSEEKQKPEKCEAPQNDAMQKANDTEQGVYHNPENGVIYKWNQSKQLWESDCGEILYPSFSWNTTQNYTDEQTGKSYTWDQEKQVWNESTTVKAKGKKSKSKTAGVKRSATKPEWFEVEEGKNTNVYVSGLPYDITKTELSEIMSKCGIIATNPVTGEMKLKLYLDKIGNPKGDGLCCYMKRESVSLALQLLDEMDVRGSKIKVQEAQFELKGNYDASKKPKMLSKKEKKKLLKEKERLLDWKLARAEETVHKTDRVVIFKNMFDVKEFEEDPVQITEIRDDLRKECEKFGSVKKVIVFDRHPDGVCSVAFKEVEPALECQKALNGRWFACRTVEASIWDGVTDYQVEETDKERELRLKQWEKFLTGEEKKDDDDTAAQDTSPADSNQSEVPQQPSDAAESSADSKD